MIILETEHLNLKEHSSESVQPLYKIFSDPITMQFWPAPFELAGVEQWIQRSIQAYPTGLGRLAVILKSNNELIGDCGLIRSLVNGVEENDLGYIFDKSYWRKGLATEAASACLHYGLNTLGLKRIVANMEKKHLASKAVAEKIGFRLESEFINTRNRNLPTYLLSIASGNA